MWVKQFTARLGHYAHDYGMFCCIAYVDGHLMPLMLLGLGVTVVVVAVSLVWKEIE